MDMERVPGLDQLTDMWESDDEPEEDGVGDGQVVLRGKGGGGGAAEVGAAMLAAETDADAGGLQQ
jgi:hypothetical protein